MPIGNNNSQESFASGGNQLCLGTYDWGFIYACLGVNDWGVN